MSFVCRSRLRAVSLVVGIALHAHAAAAAVFQAGPNATPPYSIQGAIDAAIAEGGDNEVRVQGVLFSNLATIAIQESFSSGSLRITGGWDATFTVQSDATPTVLDADGLGRVLRLRPAGGTVIVEDVEIRDGFSAGDAAGVEVTIAAATVELRRVRIEENAAITAAGGLGAFLFGEASLLVEDSWILGNEAINGAGGASGGGVYLSAVDGARFTLQGNHIAGNTVQATGNQGTGGGIYAAYCDAATGELTDNVMDGNEILGDGRVGANGALWQVNCDGPATGTLTLRRNQWREGSALVAQQLSLITSGTGTMLFSDSLIVGGIGSGLTLDARDESVLRVTNATIADNASFALVAFLDTEATLSVFNTIVFGNGIDAMPNTITTGSNLVGVNPFFSGPLYRPGAPAIDAGTASPPGGLGPTDLVGGPRTIGAAPDIGAIEVPEPAAGVAALATAAALVACRRRRGRRER